MTEPKTPLQAQQELVEALESLHRHIGCSNEIRQAQERVTESILIDATNRQALNQEIERIRR